MLGSRWYPLALSKEWATGKKSLALSLLALVSSLWLALVLNLLFPCFFSVCILWLYSFHLSLLSLPPACLAKGMWTWKTANPSTFTFEISFGRCPAETLSSPLQPAPRCQTHHFPSNLSDAHPRALSDFKVLCLLFSRP